MLKIECQLDDVLLCDIDHGIIILYLYGLLPLLILVIHLIGFLTLKNGVVPVYCSMYHYESTANCRVGFRYSYIETSFLIKPRRLVYRWIWLNTDNNISTFCLVSSLYSVIHTISKINY